MFTKLLAEHDDDEGDDNESKEVGFEFLIAATHLRRDRVPLSPSRLIMSEER